MQSNVPYDFEKDFTPVIGIGSVPNVLAVPTKANIRSIADLVALAKSTPDGLNYASGGNGSLGHISGALLVQELKIKATHVPYRGNSVAMQDLMANRVQLFFPTIIEGLAGRENRRGSPARRDVGAAGRKRAGRADDEGARSGAHRSEDLVRLPRPGEDPAGDRGASVRRDLEVGDPARRTGATEGLQLHHDIQTGPQFRELMRSESARWQKVIQENGIKVGRPE